jgi:hypothetical protein
VLLMWTAAPGTANAVVRSRKVDAGAGSTTQQLAAAAQQLDASAAVLGEMPRPNEPSLNSHDDESYDPARAALNQQAAVPAVAPAGHAAESQSLPAEVRRRMACPEAQLAGQALS